MPKTAIKIGPRDNGRRMSLDEFDLAEVVSGYMYELGRGDIIVTDIPGKRHVSQFSAIRKQFVAYEAAHPGIIHTILGGGECKILVSGYDSERHPDLAVYKSSPPDSEEEIWSRWIPDLVVEIVSPGSEQRDYEEKREEYLQFGIKEYWILDSKKKEMLALCRSRGKWTEKTVHPPEIYRTSLLPALEFRCEDVFKAAGE